MACAMAGGSERDDPRVKVDGQTGEHEAGLTPVSITIVAG